MSASTAPDNHPPFETINGSGKVPLLLTCDHASRVLPPDYGTLGLDETELRRHIGWDIGAADVTRRIAAALDAPAVLSGYSRLLVDYNRAPDDPTLICEVSDGTVVPGNRDADAAEFERRIRLYHRPYHDALAAAMAALRQRVAVPAMVSIHSFTPVMKGFERPWHIGILWDKDPRLALPLLKIFGADPAIVVGDNEPYSGRSHVGYTMMQHGAAAGLPHVLLEIRQDLIDTHHGAEAWANRVSNALRQVLAAAGRFQVERY